MLHHRVSFANICNGKACLKVHSDSLFGVSSLLYYACAVHIIKQGMQFEVGGGLDV